MADLRRNRPDVDADGTWNRWPADAADFGRGPELLDLERQAADREADGMGGQLRPGTGDGGIQRSAAEIGCWPAAADADNPLARDRKSVV